MSKYFSTEQENKLDKKTLEKHCQTNYLAPVLLLWHFLLYVFKKRAEYFKASTIDKSHSY